MIFLNFYEQKNRFFYLKICLRAFICITHFSFPVQNLKESQHFLSLRLGQKPKLKVTGYNNTKKTVSVRKFFLKIIKYTYFSS